ncbi:MAG: sugar ABC transporter permease [Treponema sp.]|jgi:multiple sugar transport system permease protein/raffinose/stachyose/melibiose transport system permease protein|nr:sugar ABC transporter permease [Treponema sp.]
MNRTASVKNAGNWLGCFAFAAPAVLFYILFVVVPIFGTVNISFHRWNGASPGMIFIGLENYRRIFTDPVFYRAIGNNVIWILFTIFVPVFLGLILATLISRPFVKAKLLYRLTYFMPNVVSLVAVGIVWGWIYNPVFGILERFLVATGIPGADRIDFLGDPNLVIWSLVIAGSWTAFGFNMTVFLAAIQGIDNDYLEVAILEGANFVQIFVHVIVPAIKGTITLLVLNSLIGSFKVFDIIMIMTKGGPYHSSEVVSTYMYSRAFLMNEYGYGAAVAIVLAVVIAVCSTLYMRAMEKE